MIEKDWRELFSPEALQRGFQLYKRGAAEIDQCNEFGFNGNVFFRDENYCMVNLRDGLIEDMKCSTEDDISDCAYLAAMLYRYDPDLHLKKGSFFKSSFDDEVDDCMDEMLEKASSYKEIDEVVEKTENYMWTKIEEFVEKSQYEAALRFSFSTFGFLSLLVDENYDELEQKGYDEEVFFKKLQAQWCLLIEDMDDKKDAFKELERIFHYPYSNSFEDYLTDIFLECFNEDEFYEDKYRVINHMLLGSKAKEDMWDVRMQYDDWMEIGLEMMVNAHRSHQDILEFLRTYHRYDDIFIDYADICIDKGNKEDALEVLDLGLQYHDEEKMFKKREELIPSLGLDACDWADLFTETIFERGYDYYRKNKIKELQQEPYGIGAIVSGTEDYHVTIDLENKQVMDMHCDCPYAAQGHNCKHMAAVLFACSKRENLNMLKERLQEKHENELLELIHNASRPQLEKFIFDELIINQVLFDRFKFLLEHDQIKYKYLNYLETLFNQYCDQGPILITKLRKYLHVSMDKLIKEKDYLTAYKMIAYVLDKITYIKIGKIDELIYELHEYLKDIIQIYPSKEMAFNGVKNLYRYNHNTVYEYFIDDIILNEFENTVFYTKKLDLIQQKIMYYSLCEDHKMYECWTKYGLGLLISANKSESSILAYVHKYADSEAVQVNYVDYFVRKGEYDKALEILDQHSGEAYENKRKEVLEVIQLHKHIS